MKLKRSLCGFVFGAILLVAAMPFLFLTACETEQPPHQATPRLFTIESGDFIVGTYERAHYSVVKDGKTGQEYMIICRGGNGVAVIPLKATP